MKLNGIKKRGSSLLPRHSAAPVPLETKATSTRDNRQMGVYCRDKTHSGKLPTLPHHTIHTVKKRHSSLLFSLFTRTHIQPASHYSHKAAAAERREKQTQSPLQK
mmetsp:Transcript_41456/g.117717  ORF Transcript_41456/g.117717 Transcript_41456/m.117717 type:complete len:105 (+) Transcript_41456:365-679(+)